MSKIGTRGAARAAPIALPLPSAYVLRVVVTATVDEALATSPVTVSGSVDPDGVPACTEPLLTDGTHPQLPFQFVTLMV